MHNQIIFISFGNFVIHRQNLFSILSAVYYIKNNNENLKILIYTDNQYFFRPWLDHYSFIDYYVLDSNVITNWKGQYNYVFRVKIKSIEHSLENLNSKTLYLDGDTFFKESPSLLFPKIRYNNTLMYLKEGSFLDANFKNWECIQQHMRTHQFNLENNVFNFPLEQDMWNAGVIGIDYTNKQLIDLVLNLTDQYCSQNPLNIYHQDQVMFSYVFQNNTVLQSTDDVIFHYCYGTCKEHMNNILLRFFKQVEKYSFDEILTEVHKLTQKTVPDGAISQPLLKTIIIFLQKRKIGLSMAIARVKKTKKLSAFFQRGEKY